MYIQVLRSKETFGYYRETEGNILLGFSLMGHRLTFVWHSNGETELLSEESPTKSVEQKNPLRQSVCKI